MMMQFLFVLLAVFMGGFLGTFGTIKFIQKNAKYENFSLNLPLGLCSFFPVFFGAVFLSLLAPESVSFTLLSGIALVVLFTSAVLKNPSLRLFWSVFVLAVPATFLLPDSLIVWSETGAFFGFLLHLSVAVLIALTTTFFALLDRVPLLSLAMALAFVLCFLFLGFFTHFLPIGFVLFSMILLMAQTGVAFCLNRFIPFRLGDNAAWAFGFMWSFCTAYFIANDQTALGLSFYAYPVFELIYCLIATWFGTKTLALSAPFLIERALATNVHLSRLFRWTFLSRFICLVFIGLGASLMPSYIWTVLLAIVLIDIYVKFTGWDKPQLRMRDVWADLKTGLTEVKNQIRQPSENQPTPVKPVEKRVRTDKTTKRVAAKSPKTTKSAKAKKVPAGRVSKKNAVKSPSKQRKKKTQK